MPSEAEARAALESMTQAALYPTLTDAELTRLLNAVRLVDAAGYAPAVVWQAGTAYTVGQVIGPTVANGHRYLVTVAGTSGTVEPAWPTETGATVGDGTVTLAEYGTGWTPTYDLNRAALAGWQIKAGKAAGDFGFSADGARFDRNQVVEHCRLMVAEYRRKIAGTLVVH